MTLLVDKRKSYWMWSINLLKNKSVAYHCGVQENMGKARFMDQRIFQKLLGWINIVEGWIGALKNDLNLTIGLSIQKIHHTSRCQVAPISCGHNSFLTSYAKGEFGDLLYFELFETSRDMMQRANTLFMFTTRLKSTNSNDYQTPKSGDLKLSMWFLLQKL